MSLVLRFDELCRVCDSNESCFRWRWWWFGAGDDPVVIELEPRSACAGIRQEPLETVDKINVDEPPERVGEAGKTPSKRQAEHEVFIGTPERGSEARPSTIRE